MAINFIVLSEVCVFVLWCSARFSGPLTGKNSRRHVMAYAFPVRTVIGGQPECRNSAAEIAHFRKDVKKYLYF